MSFESIPIDPQTEWTPTPTSNGVEQLPRESFDPDTRPDFAELSDKERIEVAQERLAGSENSFIEHQLNLLKRGKVSSFETANLGSLMIKNMVDLNLLAQNAGKANTTQISPENSIQDIIKYLNFVLDRNEHFSQGQAPEYKRQLRESIETALVGARAEFAVADALRNGMGKQVFFPAEIPYNEDLTGIDWWVNMGRTEKGGPRQVSALQVKSVEGAKSEKNQIVYPLPSSRGPLISKTVDQLISVIGDERFEKMSHSLQNTRRYTGEKYPSTHPALILLNPIDDIDYKTGVLHKHALERLQQGMYEMISA